MKHTILYLALSLIVISCGNKTDKNSLSQNEKPPLIETAKIGQNNYAVIWKWTTNDSLLVSENSTQISNELIALWKKNTVENVYYNSQSKIDKLEYFPNISFFLKAYSKGDAKTILEDLTIVTKGIATYQLYSVGSLWLGRQTDVINKKGITQSYVSIWTTKPEATPTISLKVAQNDSILSLWNKGSIENVYFDIEGTQKENNITDFVFYINANSKEEAIKLCNSLPFYKEKIATYKIHPAGVFWMGKYQTN